MNKLRRTNFEDAVLALKRAKTKTALEEEFFRRAYGLGTKDAAKLWQLKQELRQNLP